jgi:hypothetical protein
MTEETVIYQPTPVGEMLRLAAGIEATCPKNDPDVREVLFEALVHFTAMCLRSWEPKSAEVTNLTVIKGGKE